MDVELCQIVLDDLSAIEKNSGPESSDHEIRRLSGEIRRLLIEGQLQKCWKMAGFEKSIRISAPKLIVPKKGSFVEIAAAGGVILPGGMEISNLFIAYTNQSDKEFQEMKNDLNRDLNSSFTVSEYLESTCIIYKNTKINRSNLIKWFANKKGGIHFDKRRKKEDTEFRILDEIYNKNTVGGYISKNAEVLGKDLSISEFLAVAQHVSMAADVKSLREKIVKITNGLA